MNGDNDDCMDLEAEADKPKLNEKDNWAIGTKRPNQSRDHSKDPLELCEKDKDNT